MFGNKDNNVDSNSSLISNTMKPIYILGNNALSVYLYSKFVDAGEKVIIITNRRKNLIMDTMTIKEDFSLSKIKLKIQTSFWIKDEPKLLIITSANNEINADITTLSPSKLTNTPIVSFTFLNDCNHIEGYLKKPLIPAFFDGYLTLDSDKVSNLGRTPNVDILTDGKDDSFIIECFEKAQIKITPQTDRNKLFWSNFAPFAVGSLITSLFNKTMSNILKEKENRDLLSNCCNEICQIAKSQAVSINGDEIIKKLHNVPSNYSFDLQTNLSSSKFGELEFISNTILTISRNKEIKAPHLNHMIGKIFNITLT